MIRGVRFRSFLFCINFILRNNLFFLFLRGWNNIFLKGIWGKKGFFGYVFFCFLFLDCGGGVEGIERIYIFFLGICVLNSFLIIG